VAPHRDDRPDLLTAAIESLTPDQLEALAVRLAPFLPKTEIAAPHPDPPAVRQSPFATITEAADYLNLTRRSVEGHLATGRLTPVKHGMPQNTPRDRWRHWPTRIAWFEIEDFANGKPTGRLAEAASHARARPTGHTA